MVEISEIVDRDSLEAWLELQPKEIGAALAVRCAIRVWPLLIHSKKWLTYPTRITFYGHRALLTAGVALLRPSYKTKIATRRASAVVSALAYPVDAVVAKKVARSAGYALDAIDAGKFADGHIYATQAIACANELGGKSIIWDNVHSDLAHLMVMQRSGSAILEFALWDPADVPPFDAEWRMHKEFLSALKEDWEVWFPIYERFLRGEPQNWEMLEEIVLIPEEDWAREDDPGHVNGLIAGIVAKYVTPDVPPFVSESDLSSEKKSSLEDHAAYLISAGAHTEIAARRAAGELEEVVSAYLQAAQVNQLPEELQIFQQMVVSLRGVRDAAGGEGSLDQSTEEMKKRILELEVEVETLLKRVRKAEYQDSFQMFSDAAVVSAGKVAGPAVLTGATFFLSRFVDPGTVHALTREFEVFVGAWRGS